MAKAAMKVLAWVLGAMFFQGCAQSRAVVPQQDRSETTMTKRASGPFDVKLTPMSPDAEATGSPVGRLRLDKRFHGDLEATSEGQMLAVRTPVQGSAGYVAMEQVSGRLHGREGTFAFQHSGSMNRGTPELKVTVVPDSGTGQLTGLSGSMNIHIDEKGNHTYDLEYSLPDAP